MRRGGPRIPEPEATTKPVYKPAPSMFLPPTTLFCTQSFFLVPPVIPVPLLEPAISRLSEQLTLLTSSHAKNSATLQSLGRDRENLDDKEKEIRIMVDKAEEKRAWFSSFKEWVESVAAFLDEKVLSLLPVHLAIELNMVRLVSDARKDRGRTYFAAQRASRYGLRA